MKFTWFVTVLLIFNFIFMIPLFEELKDASDPNAGYFTMIFTPIISIVSCILILGKLRKGIDRKGILIMILTLNVLILLFLVTLFIYGVLIMI
ncbi:hypothetical protein [Robertmurraya kyonggiensis]|uniref:Uncharacterized protein n=1 Tax=Robertmurraya kyonggiensis TaxID=1037680 RepID=A0A4U1DCG4_9BACI|nr:hypothetical protein [Robertmurraya kyonggiensis]TKC19176.1 hypothetical protein FA727_06440 [Robertmurraya kyonggiensis]